MYSSRCFANISAVSPGCAANNPALVYLSRQQVLGSTFLGIRKL